MVPWGSQRLYDLLTEWAAAALVQTPGEVNWLAQVASYAAQALWLSLFPIMLVLGIRAGLRYGWERGGLVLGSALLAGVMAMPGPNKREPMALYLVRYAQHRGLEIASRAIQLDSRMWNASKANVTRWCLDRSRTIQQYEMCIDLSQILRLPRWLNARLNEESPWGDTKTFERRIEEAYAKAVQRGEEKKGWWTKVKNKLRELKDGLSATTRALVVQVYGGYHVFAGVLALSEGKISVKTFAKIAGGATLINPVEAWAILVSQIGLHAIKLFTAAALYAGVLIWVLSGWWFAVLYPLKAGALALKEEGHIAALRLFASFFGLAIAPLVWVLLYGLVAVTTHLYLKAWPALLSATWWVLWQTGTLHALAATKYALYASLASGLILATPLALALLTTPIMLERWLGGLASHFAPRIFPVG